jgi:2-polyprenyl-3-methyl-5-hydroxy-6-metoxy-1,4-benzoquinol methylase
MTQTEPQGPETLMQMFQGVQVAGVLTAGIQLGVFDSLAAGPAGAEAVAARIKCPVRSTRILLDALAAFGLLRKEARTYALSDLSQAHLVPGKPMYMGDLAGLFSGPQMWTGYLRLAEAVKNDGTVMPEHAETPRYPFWETFARSTGAIAFPAAAALDGHLGSWIASRPKVRVLDIAAGSGIYGFTLAKHANVELTSLDWPNVLVETRQWAKRLGVDESRVRYLEGNLFEVDFGGPFDLVVMSHIYHHFDDATCSGLTRKVAVAMSPSGRLAIHDFLFDETLANPMGAIFSTTMLVSTRRGEAFAEADYKKWIRDSGLTHVATHASAGMPSSFVLADKP